MDSIRSDTSISEVILSGGDPLLLGDQAFATLINEIDAIEHVQRIRVHSRLPIVLPQRVTQSLVGALRSSRCPTVLVVHCNHAHELDAQTKRAFACLRDAGVHLLNQSVLLAGVNDETDLLCQRLPGYLLPRLVREIPGKASKSPLQTEGLQLVDIS